MKWLVVFPNQLYELPPAGEQGWSGVIVTEDTLFYGDSLHPLQFHKQKLWLHRATQRRFADACRHRGLKVKYLEYDPQPDPRLARIRQALPNRSRLSVYAPTDHILNRRLRRLERDWGTAFTWLPDPGFLNSPEENRAYRQNRKRWFMADFYKWQRQRRQILVTANSDPVGGQWSFDQDNRKKIPTRVLNQIPPLPELARDEFDEEACRYVLRTFPDNPGSLEQLIYPTSSEQATEWLQRFLVQRLERFGDYEDGIVPGESWLWHSVLTPSLNIGLLTPDQIVQATLRAARDRNVPLNSLEGFIRQVIGWREFMRATYMDLGVTMRTTNYWGHLRPLPDSVYTGSTGLPPLDDTIQRILQTGYCHHIERLMVLGNFFFLCEIEPTAIYRWFMEMFVDSYDWVMVPNVYAMSQNADGGLITTKPYFSGSAYLRKMSHYPAGPWCHIWDGLYWRWIWKHCAALQSNPRWAMMCKLVQKMDPAVREGHIQTAERFLKNFFLGKKAPS